MPRRRRPAVDHRTLAGRARSERTRRALVESAMLVFAQRGADASVIDEVIALARVARGTFYNHFRGNDDLFDAVAAEVGNQLVALVDPRVLAEDDAAARVATGVRLVLAIAVAHPRLAAFLARSGPRAAGPGSVAAASVPRDVALGMAQGRFTRMPVELATDLVVGPVFAAFQAMRAPLPRGYAGGLARGILQALGVPPARARRLAERPLDPPIVPDDSLLARAEARADATIAERPRRRAKRAPQ